MPDLNKLFADAHAKTGGQKKIDAAQHAESCAALLDELAKLKPSAVLTILEYR